MQRFIGTGTSCIVWTGESARRKWKGCLEGSSIDLFPGGRAAGVAWFALLALLGDTDRSVISRWPFCMLQAAAEQGMTHHTCIA